MSPIRSMALAATALISVTAARAEAADKTAADRAAVMQEVARCRAVSGDSARLACYDKAVTALDEAEKHGDVVIVDRAQVREAKRQTFGLNLNLAPIFERGAAPEKIERLTSTVAGASQMADGKWVITTADGQVWRQIDTDPLFDDPHKGEALLIRPGALGSYFMKIGSDRAMRVHRDQ